MGCDEHFYLEVRREGRWTSFAQPTDDGYGEIRLPQFEKFTGGRNYNAYALIADVRNGISLFGGSRAFIPISDAKGVPSDASPEYLIEVESWGCDGHSHTWLTLTELLSYPWYRHSEIVGTMGIRHYAQWSEWSRDDGRAPNEWSGGVSGPGIQIFDMIQADKFLEDKKRELGGTYYDWAYGRGNFAPIKPFFDTTEKIYVSASWHQPYTEAVGDLYTRGIPEMCRIRDELGITNDDVRAVGFFDN